MNFSAKVNLKYSCMIRERGFDARSWEQQLLCTAGASWLGLWLLGRTLLPSCVLGETELGLDGGWRGRQQFGRLTRFRNCERWLAPVQRGYWNSCSGSFYKAAAEIISVTGDALCSLKRLNGFQQFLWSLANVLQSTSERGCKYQTD